MWSGYQLIPSLSSSSCSLHGGRLHVPARLGVVEERRVAAPAVRVGVLVLLRAEQPAGLAQRLDDPGSASFTHMPANGPIRSSKVPSGWTGFCTVSAVLLAEPEVVLAERDAGVHDARAVLGGRRSRRRGPCGPLAVVGDVRERRLVARARAAPSPASLRLDLVRPRRAPARRAPRRRSASSPSHARAHVGDVGTDRERGVRQRASTASSSSRAPTRPARPSAGSARTPTDRRRPCSPAPPRATRARCRSAGSTGTTLWPSYSSPFS